MKSGDLNFLETSGPLQAYNGTALPFIMLVPCFKILRVQYRHRKNKKEAQIMKKRKEYEELKIFPSHYLTCI